MVSPIERPPSPSSPSFDSLDLGPDADDGSWSGRFDRVLVTVEGWRDRPMAALAMAAVAVVLVAGAWWLGRSPPRSDAAAIPMVSSVVAAPGPAAGAEPEAAEGRGPTSTGPVTTMEPTELLVHVAGAVARPGIVRLEPGARIVDAVDAAGGPLVEAQVHRLNLAAPVVDGMQVVVPVAGEPVTHPAGIPPPVTPGDASTAGPGPVDLNQAGPEQLETLHGIGPALATAIVRWRTEHGPFTSVDQLLDVPGIGPATLDGLVDQVVV